MLILTTDVIRTWTSTRHKPEPVPITHFFPYLCTEQLSNLISKDEFLPPSMYLTAFLASSLEAKSTYATPLWNEVTLSIATLQLFTWHYSTVNTEDVGIIKG